MEKLEKLHTDLWNAVVNDDLDFVKKHWTDKTLMEFVDNSVKNSIYSDCAATSFLSPACNQGAEKVVDWLIDNHEFTQFGLDESLAYTCSGGNGKLSIVKKLYEAGANPIAKTTATYDIWEYAKRDLKDGIMDYLKECGAEKKKKEFIKIFNKQKKTFRALVNDELDFFPKHTIELELTERKKEAINGSFIGGIYALPPGFETPSDSEGEELGFLVQLNLEDAKHAFELPNSGILQFYIKNKSYYWGNDSSVCYFENSDTSNWVNKQSVLKINPKEIQFSEEVTMFPQESSLELVNFKEKIKEAEVDQFPDLDRHIKSDIISKICRKKNPKCNNFLLGHPNLVQNDPRWEKDRLKDWILLLQLDGIDKKYEMWGRDTAAYWFIHPDDLKARNFDSVYFCLQK